MKSHRTFRWPPATAIAFAALYVLSAIFFLWIVHGVNRQGLLTGEETSVSFVGPAEVAARFQWTSYSTNFGGQLFYWIAVHVTPRFNLFYGREWKALAMALLPGLVFLVLHRRFRASFVASLIGGVAAALMPGLAAFSWLATENGLEAVIGVIALLVATSERRGWQLAPILAALSISAYGGGLAWAAAVVLTLAVRLFGLRSPRTTALVVASAIAGGLILVFPLFWWHGGVIVTGGGSAGSGSIGAALSNLVKSSFSTEPNYYYFSTSPALGAPYVWVLGALGLLIALRDRRCWSWHCVAVATVGLYAVSGGVLGVRRTIALAVLSAVGVGVSFDMFGRGLSRLRAPLTRERLLAPALVGILGVVLIVLMVGPISSNRKALESGSLPLPADFVFPTDGHTMTQEIEILGRQAARGVPWVTIASTREGTRSAALVALFAAHGQAPAGSASSNTVKAMYEDGPRCEMYCHRVAAVQ